MKQESPMAKTKVPPRRGKHMVSGSKWRLISAHGSLFKGTLIATIRRGGQRLAIFSVPVR